MVQPGEEVGLDADEIRSTLQSQAFVQEIQQDQYEAQQAGVKGISFLYQY
ncbi:MAG: hypothetical protein WKG06_03315 [Segetibacter sp.]